MKDKKINLSTAILVVFLACLITFAGTFVIQRTYYNATDDSKYNPVDTSSQLNIGKLTLIDSYIRNNFIGTPDYNEINEMLCAAYMAALNDRYTTYHTREDMEKLREQNEGKLVGIGVRVTTNSMNGTVCVTHVMKDSPALEVGIKPGDFIYAVNGEEVTKENVRTIIKKVAGEPGTKVKIKIKRDEAFIEYDITRKVVNSQSIFVNYKDDTAVFKIFEFEGNAAKEFISYTEEAKKKGIDNFIFDLRGNPGGDLQIIVNILDYLLPEGPIVNIVNSKGQTVQTYSSDKNHIDGNFVVLVDGETASAAELFTSALSDYKKCTIVGETTYGKGVMQNILMLPDGSGIRFTSHYYNPPFSENYHGKGIKPDVEVKAPEHYTEGSDDDIQLKKALEVIKKR